MGLINKSIDQIIAPMRKVIADLEKLAATEGEKIKDRGEIISNLQVENRVSEAQIARAESLVDKYKDLV